MSKSVLWDAFRQGDEQAFTAIFLEHYDALYGYGIKLTGDEDIVRDSIQELFQKLWERRASLEEIDSLKPYLFKALRYRISDHLKLTDRRTALQESYQEEFDVVYLPEDFPGNQSVSSEQHAQLLAALNQLPNRQREVLYLRYFDGFSHERISEIMNLTPQSVRNLTHRAIKALKELFLVLLYYRLAMGR